MELNNDTTQMIQQELPLALVRGEAVIEKPQDLFIPPDALEIILESFEGPLDFLLYLIRKQKFDISDLPIFEITAQYMEYVEVMRELNLELAAEYLVMAAMLAEIKSRILLPKHDFEDDAEEDPRAELVRRLQQYEVIKKAASELDELPRQDREFAEVNVVPPSAQNVEFAEPDVELAELVLAFSDILKRAAAFEHHSVSKEQLSTRERMSQILNYLNDQKGYVDFSKLFKVKEGKAGVVVTFLAVMELVKETLIDVSQSSVFGQIYVQSAVKRNG